MCLTPRIDIERPENLFFGRKLLEGETEQGMELQVGSILEGKVTSITKFGAFVALEGGKSGLVHISEIANTFVNDVHEFLQEGQEVKVMVLSAENGKINLSIKRLEAKPQRENAPRAAANRPAQSQYRSAPTPPPAPKTADQLFEEKLKAFMTESDSKLSSIKQYSEHRTKSRRR